MLKYSFTREEYFMEKRDYQVGIELTDKQWKN